MTNAELYLAAKDIINLVHPNLKVIKAYQSKRAPTGSYAEVNIIEGQETHSVPLVYLSDTAKVSSPIGDVSNVSKDVRQQLISHVSVEFYRDNANQLARDMLDSCWRPDVHDFLLRNNLGWHRNDPIANLSATINGKYEERARFNVYLMHEYSVPIEVNAIYSTEVIVTEDDNQVADITIDIPITE